PTTLPEKNSATSPVEAGGAWGDNLAPGIRRQLEGSPEEGQGEEPEEQLPPAAEPEEPKKKESEGSLLAALGGLILLGSLPFFAILGGAMGFLQGSGPNPNGTTRPQTIDVSQQTGEVAVMLNFFKSASSTADFLRTDGEVLSKYEANLIIFAEKLRNNDPAYATITRREELLTLIDTMLAQIRVIRSHITAGSPDKAATEAKKLMANIDKLDTLAAPPIREMALALADENEQSGYSKYQYSKDNRAEFARTGEGDSDCSSFASTMLYKAGLISSPELYTTVGLYLAARDGRNGLSIVSESKTSTGIPDEDIRAILRPGDVLLSADAAYSQGGGSAASRHAVLYVGNNEVVQSTHANGKNGIQKTSLEDRLKRRNQVIIRGGGGI
ncbi:MAG TPA: hypothetical protein VLA04_06805, partial [Verrucomicrobiae bacterium]|nr:hypothetical protein [Verrucomicrobiae bacterium]